MTILLFLAILAVVAVAIFAGLKLAFLLFLGIVTVGIIVIALMVGGFIQLANEADDGHGPLDKVLFGE